MRCEYFDGCPVYARHGDALCERLLGYCPELQGECPCVGNLFACMENEDCPAILRALEQGAGGESD